MAVVPTTFTWLAGTTANWSTLADWSPLPVSPPGTVAANKDSVNFLESGTGNKNVYTVTISPANSFDIATLNIGNATATHHQPALSISGSLFIDNLAYSQSVANGVTITINAGGLLDIRAGITNFSNSAETIDIAGTGTGGHLEFGSASASGLGINDPGGVVTFSFANNPTGINAGVIEYLSGFNPAGTTTNQHIGNFAWGDGIIFDGANFNGDTFAYAGTTLTVTNGTTTVLTMNNLSVATGAGLTSNSFIARGNEILVAPVGSFTWGAVAGGNWSTKADWTPNNAASPVYPGSGDNNPSDTATIGVAGTYTVHYDVANNTIAALTVNNANATLAFDQSAADALTVTGATTLTAGTISVNSATSALSTGTFTQKGGTFTEKGGTVNVTGLAALTTGTGDSISSGKFNAGTLTVGTALSFQAGTITSGAGGVNIASGSTVTISAPADLNATTGGLKDGGTIIGSGTIDGAISGSGSLKASGGTLDLKGNVSGPTLVIDTIAGSDLKIDSSASSGAQINISNAAQTLEIGVSGALTIGAAQAVNAGAIKMDGGTLTDKSGITFSNKGGLTGSGILAANLAGDASDTIQASGGTLDLTGTFGSGLVAAIDASRASDLKFDNTATVSTLANITSTNQTLEIGASGIVTLTGTSGYIVSGGEIKMSGGSLTDNKGIGFGNGTTAGTLFGFGAVTAALSQFGTGNVVEASGGLLSVSGAVAGSGLTYEIDNISGSILELTPGPNPTTTGNFDFLGSTGELEFNGSTASSENVAGLNVGTSKTVPTNFIDFLNRGVSITDPTNAGSGTSGIFHLSDGTTLNLSAITSGSGTWFVDTLSVGGGTELFLSSVVCYAAGTRILTTTGERAVECLMQGDIVLTLAGGELVAQPVKWIGQRRINLTAHPHPETVAPIRIRRGAFAEAMPHRDLLLSPDHAVFVDGKLICARQLVNGTTIRQEEGWASVEYFHVELDEHGILLAEGLAAESYLNTGNRGFFANSGEPLVLHPDMTDETDYPMREAGSCAPFVSDEASVRPVWQRLAERAAGMGQPALTPDTTSDPELRIVAKGRTVRPLYGENGLYIFALPKGATKVRLVSRAGAPADARPWLDDRRCLGVNVERIVLRGSSELREIPVDHPDLSQGWQAVERDGTALRRWTSEALLPLPVLRGPTMLEIRASSGGMAYLTGADQERRAA